LLKEKVWVRPAEWQSVRRNGEIENRKTGDNSGFPPKRSERNLTNVRGGDRRRR